MKQLSMELPHTVRERIVEEEGWILGVEGPGTDI
jgi:hypothetical protein